jgi:hypothetical protein
MAQAMPTQAQLMEHLEQQQRQLEQVQATVAQQVIQLQQQDQHAVATRGQVEAAQAQAAAAMAAIQARGPEALQANGMPRGYRPEGPPKFYGRGGDDVEAWLFQLDETNRLFPIVNEMSRVRYAALSLRDTAAKWYSAVQMKRPPIIVDWATFIAGLRQQFLHLDQKFVARGTLHTLTQKGSVRDFSVKFRNLQILIPDMSEPDALDRFIRGLKDFSFKVWRRKFTTLDAAIVYAEELDLETRQKQLLSGGNTTSGGKFNHGSHRAVQSSSRQTSWAPGPVRVVNQPGGSAPMDVSVLRMDEQERSRHMKNDLCFNCHKPGHRANVCPAKRSQGNGGRRR